MATEINFSLTGLREKVLIKIANQNTMTPEEYAKNIVTSFLNAQVRGHYLSKFNALTTVDMVNLFGDLT